MKKLSLLIILVTFSLAGFSQPKFGFKGGLNLSNVEISGGGTSPSPESITGFYGGVFLDNEINEKFLFGIGAQYIQRGFSLSGSGIKFEFNYSYIDIPVMLKFRLNKSEESTTSIYLAGVARPGFLMSAKGKASVGSDSGEEDIKDQFESFHFGIGFGGGIEIETGNITIIPEALYNIGLTNIAKDSGDTKINFSDFTIGVGIRMN